MLNWETLKDGLGKKKFGAYKLYFGSNLVSRFPFDEDDKENVESKALIARIDEEVTMHGPGSYTLYVRSKPAANDSTALKLPFYSGEERQAAQKQQPSISGMQGLGWAQLQSMTEEARKNEREHQRDIFRMRAQMMSLKHQMQLQSLRRRRAAPSVHPLLGQAMPAIQMAIVAIVSKVAPEAMPAVQEVIRNMSEFEPDEPETIDTVADSLPNDPPN